MVHNNMKIHEKNAKPWRVTLVDTGEKSMTGGRLKWVKDYLKDEEAFCFTYRDGLSDIDISASVAFHQAYSKLATVSAVLSPGRFGSLERSGQAVNGLIEKSHGNGCRQSPWI